MQSEAIPTTPTALPDASWLRLEELAEAWRCAREEAADAYEHWSSVTSDRRRLAYAVFLAAADREAAAELDFLKRTGRR